MSRATITESVATFEQRANDARLGQEWIDAFKVNNLATLAKLCYAVTLPGTAPSDAQVAGLMQQLRPGVAPSLADTSAIKQLIFEAQTFMVYSLKSAVQGDEETKKLAPAERRVRLEKQRAELTGITIAGPLEPAHALYDLCTAMVESNEIKYISPTKCLSRQQELAGAKPEREVQLDATKTNLVVKEQPMVREITIASDLALHQAMTRRALALDLVGLATFSVVQRWHDRLFELYAQSPAPGFVKVSQAQLLRADRHSYLRMSETFKGSLKNAPEGKMPMDDLFDGLHTDVSVTYFLLPVAASASHHSDKGASAAASSASDNKRSADKAPLSAGAKSNPTKRVKVKGAGKSRDPMPQSLKGCRSRTPEGKQICFSYNLGKCAKKDCPRLHVCCHPGCYKQHPYSEHQ